MIQQYILLNLKKKSRLLTDIVLFSSTLSMATHSSILAWKISWAEEPGSPRGHKELDTTEHAHTDFILEGKYYLIVMLHIALCMF